MTRLAELSKKRNKVDREIAVLIGRPAATGHIGEYIASRVFGISLAASASHRGADGHFSVGSLVNHSVNIKWYPKREGILDISPESPPDYYLVLAGPKSAAASSRGTVRPLVIEVVYLFDAQVLADRPH